mmetsp:Transcript_96381/g.152419  ORF Transcript_96381/g.152419 Transcript_96381/m.152419 type:complete len:394 (-) Transcript_96381:81-1262(-)
MVCKCIATRHHKSKHLEPPTDSLTIATPSTIDCELKIHAFVAAAAFALDFLAFFLSSSFCFASAVQPILSATLARSAFSNTAIFAAIACSSLTNAASDSTFALASASKSPPFSFKPLIWSSFLRKVFSFFSKSCLISSSLGAWKTTSSLPCSRASSSWTRRYSLATLLAASASSCPFSFSLAICWSFFFRVRVRFSTSAGSVGSCMLAASLSPSSEGSCGSSFTTADGSGTTSLAGTCSASESSYSSPRAMASSFLRNFGSELSFFLASSSKSAGDFCLSFSICCSFLFRAFIFAFLSLSGSLCTGAVGPFGASCTSFFGFDFASGTGSSSSCWKNCFSLFSASMASFRSAIFATRVASSRRSLGSFAFMTSITSSSSCTERSFSSAFVISTS